MNSYAPREEVCTHCGEDRANHVGFAAICPKDIAPINIERVVSYGGSMMHSYNGMKQLSGTDEEGNSTNLTLGYALDNGPAPVFVPGKSYKLTLTEVDA